MASAPRWPLVALGALAGMLAGCAASPPREPAKAPMHIPDPSSDWRRLAVAPFGSLLQDVQVPVHEVLMFGDEAHEECYALDAPSGRFAGRAIESYLLCFSRGRLDRVELSVSVPEAGAEAEFSRYCDDWLTGTVAISPRTSRSCSGTAARGPSFSASLGDSAGDAPDGATAALLSIVVSDNAPR